jgi:hypothetical protein
VKGLSIGVAAAAILASGVLVDVAPATNRARTPVPASLKEAESSAEDIVDFALSRQRAVAVETADGLKAAANGPAAAALRRAGVRPALIDELGRRANHLARLARTGSFLEIALAANAVSELMPNLYARFQNRVPAAVQKLDYLDREAHLRALAGQPRRVAIAVKQLGPTWSSLRPKVIAAGGVKVARAYQLHVAAMNRLAPEAGLKLQAEALHGLALVDTLERVFLR